MVAASIPAVGRLALLDDSQLFENIPYQHIARNTENNHTQKNYRKPVILTHCVIVNVFDSGTSCLYLIIYSATHIYHRSIHIALAHVCHYTLPRYFIAVHIGQLAFQTTTGSHKILAVVHSNDNHQAAPVLLVTDPVLVA